MKREKPIINPSEFADCLEVLEFDPDLSLDEVINVMNQVSEDMEDPIDRERLNRIAHNSGLLSIPAKIIHDVGMSNLAESITESEQTSNVIPLFGRKS